MEEFRHKAKKAWIETITGVEISAVQNGLKVFKALLSSGLDGLEAFSVARTHTRTRVKYLYRQSFHAGSDQHLYFYFLSNSLPKLILQT